MRLDSEQRALLSAARIGMLAIGARPPLVNPAAFHFGGGSLWMTTSRHAAKLTVARRDPRAAFLVTPEPRGRTHGVLLQGLLEAYDPRSPGSTLRAAMQGPGFALNLAGYAIKNAAFIGGYLLDLASIPADWWPHNRVLLRLVADHVELVPQLTPPAAGAERVPGAPAEVAHAVARHRTAQLCWIADGRPVLASAAWTLDGPDALAWLPDDAPLPPANGAPAALVIEHHHPFRATRMLGLCLRGRIRPEPAARDVIAARYGMTSLEEGTTFRLEAARLTWWRGFQVRTVPVARAVEPAVEAR